MNTIAVTGSIISFNTTLNGYTHTIPSSGWTNQETGNYILVWNISNVDLFASTMIDEVSIINDNEPKIDYLTTLTESLSGNMYNVELDVKRILGLVHDNVSLDQTTYDRFYNMKTARMRIYNNPDSIGTDNDVIGEYKIESNSDRRGTFINWKQTRIS